VISLEVMVAFEAFFQLDDEGGHVLLEKISAS
jgi:hypothetical protein